MTPRLTLALNLLSYLAVAYVVLGLLNRPLYRWVLRHDPELRARVRTGLAPDPSYSIRGWAWLAAIVGAAWLLSGWLR
jgi:hypothetical protein